MTCTAAKPIAKRDLSEVLDHTRDFWSEVRGERILLTGGTGFFGCWLLEGFLHANRALGLGAEITVLTRDPVRFSEKAPHLAHDPAVQLLQGDIRSFAFPAGEFGYLIHAAADTSAQAAEQSIELLGSMIDGTRRVMDFASSHGTRKLLMVSSGAVYGPQPPALAHMPETWLGGPDWLNPQAAYGEGKRAAEMIAALYARQHGIDCRIARCFAFVGPHLPLDAHFAIGNFIRDAIEGKPILIQGDGTPLRSYLYTADLTIWIWTMLLRAAKGGGCWNVGSSEAVSIADLARVVLDALGVKAPIKIMRAATPGTPLTQYVPSVEKAQRELGLQVWVGLREAIRRTAAWYGFTL